MSGFLGGAMADPIAMGLMGLAQGFGNAAMPSRMPIPLGAAFGSAAGGMQEAMTNAQKLRLLAQQEARLGQQNEIQRDQWNAAKGMMDRLPGMFGQMPAGLAGGNVAPEDVAVSPSQVQGPTSTPNGGFYNRLRQDESGGNVAAANPRSSARGPDQFIDSTWLAFAKANPQYFQGMDQQAILAARTHPELGPKLSSAATQWYAQENARALGAAGLPINDGTLALSHRYGPQGAITLLKADPSAPVASIMPREVIAANPSIGMATVGGVVNPIMSKYGTGSTWSQAGGGQPSASADMGAPPAASMPPAQVKAVNNIAQRAWQQASQLQSAAMAMTMNPFTKDMAPILMKQAEEYLKVGMWQPTVLPNGMQGFQHALTGEVKELSQPRTVQTYDQSGMMTTQLDRPGVRSFPQPGPTVEVLGPDGKVRRVDQANPSRVIPGEVPLSLEQQSAAGVQSGQRGMTPSQASVASAANRAGAERTATNTAEEWKSTRAAALDAGQRIAVLDRVEQALNNFTPGIMADRKLWLGQIAEQFGAPNPINASEGEILKGLRSRVQLALTPRGQGQITESERGLIGAQFEVMMSTPQGAKEMISMIRRLDQIDMDVAKIYADNAEKNGGQPNPIEVQREVQAYLQANPKPVVPNAAPQQTQQQAIAKPGDIVSGYRFKGGNPNDKANWELVR